MSDHTYSLPPEDDPEAPEAPSSVPDTLENWLTTSFDYRVRSVADSTAKNVRHLLKHI